MKVTHVIASGEHGGGTDVVVSLVAELASLGIENQVVTSAPGPLSAELARMGVGTTYLDMMRSRIDPRVPRALRRVPAVRGADVVHAHGTRAAFFAQIARLSPVVYTVLGLSYRQTATIRQPIGFLSELVACRADDVMTVSRSDLVSLRRRHLVGASRGHHVANGVDAVRYAVGGAQQARMWLGLDPAVPVVGTVARLVPQKGVDVLIRAMRDVPGVTLVIVGDGPLRAELEDLARPSAGRVRFLGMRDDLPAILPAFDLFALPSRWEGEPLALLEAMSCGLPCVATATGGARELLGSDRGRLVDIDDADALAAAILDLLAHPESARAYATAARAMAMERSWRSAAVEVARIYDGVARDGRFGEPSHAINPPEEAA